MSGNCRWLGKGSTLLNSPSGGQICIRTHAWQTLCSLKCTDIYHWDTPYPLKIKNCLLFIVNKYKINLLLYATIKMEISGDSFLYANIKLVPGFHHVLSSCLTINQRFRYITLFYSHCQNTPPQPKQN